MQTAASLQDIYRERGLRGLGLERVYRQLFNPELYLQAYGKLYRNQGAMTKGATDETVDGMSLKKIHRIIDLLRQEKYRWTPVRRVEIPKAKGGKRPLGIPSWSDKLLQEVLRNLLESYYEPRFSDRSHGFRPARSCHTALGEIQKTWTGAVWFIEGDISKCFDSFDHEVMLSILRKDIRDERLIRLIGHLLKAGYLEDWRLHTTLSGTPQGGIISPLLSNIYLSEFDGYVENTLIPAYTRGKRHRDNPEYRRVNQRIYWLKKKNDGSRYDEIALLRKERRTLPSKLPFDDTFRRLKYIRYADDFLLGFIGSKKEAEEIRDRLGGFLGGELKLKLSEAKTLITHASDESAKFLGYEVTVTKAHDYLHKSGQRSANGVVSLRMPAGVTKEIKRKYCKNGEATHQTPLLHEDEYTIVQRFQSVYRGLYNYFCMATNVASRMNTIRWVMEASLTKTLANKLRTKVSDIYRKYQSTSAEGLKQFQVVLEREGKKPLVATFGGFRRNREANPPHVSDISIELAWKRFRNSRSEVVTRLLNDRCELCGKVGDVEVHHIRKLSDIDKPGRRPKKAYEKVMSARRRKTLVVCDVCHDRIHSGRYDGPSF